MKTSKITKVEYVKEFGTGPNKVHYHNLWFEGEGDKPFNIAAKKQNPDFFNIGKELTYEVTDEAKRKIKRVSTNQMANKSTFVKKTERVVDPNSTSLIRNLDKFKEEDLVFIDIETVRLVKELQKDTPLYDAWEYKNRYNNELEKKTGERVSLEDYFTDKAALYAIFAKVAVIVVGRIVDDKLSVKRYALSKAGKWNEQPVLEEFNNDMIKIIGKNPKTAFAGWANIGFDQPFLAKRMMINGIQPNILLDTAGLKPWETTALDLKNEWQGTAFYPDSLIGVATALGLPSPKSKMDGSEVGEAFYKGKIADITEYCVADVLTSANIYRKLVNKPVVELK